MAKLTYLQLVNRILKRITQPEVATVTGITGQGKIISELINEAQTELWTETTNWYSLFTERTFRTFTKSGTTIAFNNANPDTITDSGNGFGSFQTGMTIKVSGSTSNDGIYMLHPTTAPTAGTLTLQSSDSLTAAAAGASVTIYMMTFPVASDFGRAYHLVDLTNDRLLTEDVTRAFAEEDPQMTSYNQPTHFSMQGDFYRFHNIPAGAYTIIDRYWKVPTTLTADADVYTLPLFCENFLIHWPLMRVLEYMNKFEAADRVRTQIYGKKGVLEKAMFANSKLVDQILRFQPSQGRQGIAPPKFPSSYEGYV